MLLIAQALTPVSEKNYVQCSNMKFFFLADPYELSL